MRTELSVLNSGVRVVSCEMPHVGSVAVGVWTAVGGRHEPAKLNGISHFIEHLLFKGTAKRSARRIMQEVEGVGGDINAETSEERTCYYVSAPAEYFRRVSSVLVDLYLNPRFTSRDIELERGVIAEEIQMYRDEPSHHVHELLSELFWKGHSLSRPITGTIDSISKFSREDLLSYKKTYYCARNTIFSVAGNIKHVDALAFAENAFENMEKRGKQAKMVVAPGLQPKPAVFTEAREIEQTHLAIGLPCPNYLDESRYAVNVLHTLLGGNGSSRLFQDLRERRGYCYGVSTYPLFLSDTGMFTISLALDASNLERAFHIMFKHFDDLQKRPVKEAELRRAKEYLIGLGRMSLERTSAQNNRIGASLLCYGRVIDPEEVHERIRRVTAEEVCHAARTVLDRTRLRIAVVGPKANEGSILKQIG